MIREPIVSGQFYPNSFDELDKQIKESFTSKFGPGELPVEGRTKNVVGIVSPHAGYTFSGAGAAWGFKEIAESKFPELFVILGLSHTGFNSCVTSQDFKTPFGLVKTDKEFIVSLTENSELEEDDEAHNQEHSIEVQIPFLQFVCKNHLKELKIAPIIVSYDLDYKEIANAIMKTIGKRSVCIIASSDFTHYGTNYRYTPFSSDIKENIYKLDKAAIDFITRMDAKGFLDYTDEKEATICGKHPIAVGIELCKLLGAKQGKLLKYYTSGDVINDYSSTVGYGSVVFD
ncbi:MAG: AmmeMemoRadiSam system protein B [Candidatus Woesearchaeota archaeon]|nr:AmmeMemoRadiSam system protein B [Candidatus Woesearchaeota archaeon]